MAGVVGSVAVAAVAVVWWMERHRHREARHQASVARIRRALRRAENWDHRN